MTIGVIVGMMRRGDTFGIVGNGRIGNLLEVIGEGGADEKGPKAEEIRKGEGEDHREGRGDPRRWADICEGARGRGEVVILVGVYAK